MYIKGFSHTSLLFVNEHMFCVCIIEGLSYWTRTCCLYIDFHLDPLAISFTSVKSRNISIDLPLLTPLKIKKYLEIKVKIERQKKENSDSASKARHQKNMSDFSQNLKCNFSEYVSITNIWIHLFVFLRPENFQLMYRFSILRKKLCVIGCKDNKGWTRKDAHFWDFFELYHTNQK